MTVDLVELMETISCLPRRPAEIGRIIVNFHPVQWVIYLMSSMPWWITKREIASPPVRELSAEIKLSKLERSVIVVIIHNCIFIIILHS